MISSKISWTGDSRFVHRMAQRGATLDMERAVFAPWRREVLQRDLLEQYRAGGKPDRWAPNAPRTIAQKGHSRPMLSARMYQFGSMSRSYAITTSRGGLRAWSLTLDNKARSSRGYPYPYALHAGWEGNARHPGYPARQHLFFPEASAGRLLRGGLNWVLTGQNYVSRVAA